MVAGTAIYRTTEPGDARLSRRDAVCAPPDRVVHDPGPRQAMAAAAKPYTDSVAIHGNTHGMSAAELDDRLCGTSRNAKLLRGQVGSNDPSSDLLKRGLASGRGVVAEWCEAAVVGAPQVIQRDILGRFQHSVADLLR